ncbi:MAG: outer membrane lipoprotein-sorting protein [Ekhidna sp.]|uniref:outer membrane lipoprotein-sorting protein n=1 Tax=Ekhidna sp. TaxID=2608089 RepID=UPI0032EEFE34
MRKFQLLFAAFAVITLSYASAQDVTVDEIIDGYFESTGGKDAWRNLKGMKISAKVNQGGMEIPLEIVQLADGKQYTKITFQGMEIKQGVFDGETMWSTNFQSMKAEKADTETTENSKLDMNDFPDSFLDYKDKGYTAELLGTETIDGAETYKVKLTKEPRMLDGKEVEDVSFYYFDAESFVPLAVDQEIKAGPQAGAIGRSTMSDYQEVEGLYFPFSMTQGIKDGPSQPLMIESIEVNPEIDAAAFAFPAEQASPTGN